MSNTGIQRAVVTPPGHDRSVWAPTLTAAPHVAAADLIDRLRHPSEPTTLVVVGAHPDDETLGLGRLAYAWATSAGPVTAVLATLGEACVDHVTARPDRIAERRLAEWHVALERLGVGDRHVIGLPDGRVAEHEEALVDRLSIIIEAIPGPIVLAAPWCADPHPDHRAVGRAVSRVSIAMDVVSIEFPVWMTYWSSPAELTDTGATLLVVDHDDAAWLAHGDAVRAFTSQRESLGAGLSPVLPTSMLEHQRAQLLLVSAERADVLVRGVR